jgi:hypothetical protein
MDAKAQLARQIASANEQLRAAQRNGRYADIVKCRERRDELLDQYPTPDSPRENQCKPTQSV